MKQPRGEGGMAEKFQPRDMWKLRLEISHMFGPDPNEPKSTGDFSNHCTDFTVSRPFLL